MVRFWCIFLLQKTELPTKVMSGEGGKPVNLTSDLTLCESCWVRQPSASRSRSADVTTSLCYVHCLPQSITIGSPGTNGSG